VSRKTAAGPLEARRRPERSGQLPVHWQPQEEPAWSACGMLGARSDPVKMARLTADRTAVTCVRCKGTRLWRET